jgi:CRP-like cAMP-binding protein
MLEAPVFREWILNIGRRNAKAKVAHLLCELSIRLGDRSSTNDAVLLALSQEELGDALGLTAVHINRMLRLLADDGLVMWTKRTVSLSDLPRLSLAGDFSPRYLHLEQLAI